MTMILVIEDDSDSRELLKRAIELAGYAVTTAEDGSQALALLNEKPFPSLILLDLSMPKMSGEDFIAAARSLPNGTSLKFVIVSGWDDIAKRTMNLGVSGYLRKPIDLRSLTREIQKHLQ